MPRNTEIDSIKLPMEVKFGKKPKTEFKVLETDIKLSLIQAPSYQDLRSYLPQFCEATWAEDPYNVYTYEEADEVLAKMFTGKTLPTALETIKLTFLVENITYIEISHLLRYRNASFSAQCTADRFQHDDAVMIPESIHNSSEFKERYETLCREMKQLYADMVDSKQVSILDARYILPKASSSFYYMSISFKDAIHFIKQRIDRAIQPKSDNILAYQMWFELCRQYPILSTLDIIDFDEPSWFWIKTARTGHSSNIYLPEDHNDKFMWNPDDFIYQKQREEMCGTDGTPSHFTFIKTYYQGLINTIKKAYKSNNK